ncbi:hypothetical protein E4T49_05871 [Aureobasidium sp. EXF-10728]|nr:hypothetical protein E4T49_05871 [Aureobasidium sp. EXF-10728]
MDNHFHTSLHELKLQLDLMNTRTASILNKSHQHSNNVTNNSSQVGHFSSVMADNAQQIKHIGATVGTLARQQEDCYQTMMHQLDALSDKLDNLADHQFTPPESPGSSVSSESCDMPRQSLDMPPATVADIGGYFYPNRGQSSHSDQQYISDASIFVGRVNRTRRTKSIANLEIFLRGSALRWFHINLRIDGSHTFDSHGELDIERFCDSLILLFGVPKSLTSASHNKSVHLMPAWMRSVIVEDYAFPALEYARQQDTLGSLTAGMRVALSKAVELYNKSLRSEAVNSDILNSGDLLDILVRLRRSEYQQKLDKIGSQQRQLLGDDTAIAKALDEEISKLKDFKNRVKQVQDRDPMATNRADKAAIDDRATTQPSASTPTVESCPPTPTAPCQPASGTLSFAPQTTDRREELHKPTTVLSDMVGTRMPVPPDVAKKFGFRPGREPAQKQDAQSQHPPEQQQQQIPQVPVDFHLGPQAKTFLGGFKVFPPTSINPSSNTEDYENYKIGVVRTLTHAVIMQESSVACFQQTHERISQLEAAGQTPTPDLVSARDAAKKGVQDAKSKIDDIRNENERNRLAWTEQSKPPHHQNNSQMQNQKDLLLLLKAMKSAETLQTNHDIGAHSHQQASVPSEQNFPQLADCLKRNAEPYVALSPKQDNYLSPGAIGGSRENGTGQSHELTEDTAPGPDSSLLADLNSVTPTPAATVPVSTSSVITTEGHSPEIFLCAGSCLAGLSFVFTGQFKHMSREQGQELVKRHGGKWNTSPNKTTTYVVLGAEFDPRKLQTIQEHNLKTLDEEGLFNLIKRRSPVDPSHAAQPDKASKKAKKVVETAQTATASDQESDLNSVTTESTDTDPGSPGYGGFGLRHQTRGYYGNDLGHYRDAWGY